MATSYLSAKVINTNAYWLGKQATNLGVNVKRITVVQDIVEEVSNVVREVDGEKTPVYNHYRRISA